MADRQDIDALIVGALYGELDDADRARLEVHLSSHPEDRAALEALERTRATVRRGIEAMPEPEPSPAITTMLLREAGRLAPAPGRAASAAETAGEEGLWSRFLRWARPVAMHPAFAGAAALLLVAGTATALWVRGGEVAEPEAPRAAERERAPATPPADDPAPAAPALVPGTEGDYRVDLDQGGAGKLDDEIALDKNEASGEREKVARGDSKDTSVRKRKDKAPEAAGYIDTKPKADPFSIKDVPADGKESKKVAKVAAEETVEAEDDAKTSRGAQVAKQGRAVAGGGAGAPAPEPKPRDPALEEWAQGAHARLVKLVADGKCPEAGRLGAEIKDRAPEYYAANVANDRAIRACKSYIEGQAKKKAEKNYKSRSQSNTYDESADSVK